MGQLRPQALAADIEKALQNARAKDRRDHGNCP